MTTNFTKTLIASLSILLSLVSCLSGSEGDSTHADKDSLAQEYNDDLYFINSESTTPGKIRSKEDVIALRATQKVWSDSLTPNEFQILWPIYQICYDRMTRKYEPDKELDPDIRELPAARLSILDVTTGNKNDFIRDPRKIVYSTWGVYRVSLYPFAWDVDNFYYLFKQNDELRLFSITETESIYHELCKIAKNKDYNVTAEQMLNCMLEFENGYYYQRRMMDDCPDPDYTRNFGPVTFAPGKK